jgi:hypothetical protein
VAEGVTPCYLARLVKESLEKLCCFHVTPLRVASLHVTPSATDFFQRHRGHLSRHFMWCDSSISRVTEHMPLPVVLLDTEEGRMKMELANMCGLFNQQLSLWHEVFQLITSFINVILVFTASLTEYLLSIVMMHSWSKL